MSYAKNKVYECKIQNDLFGDTRICKSQFIATHNEYKQSEIDVYVNKKYNIIELFADKKPTLRADISLAISQDEYNMLSLGYGNFIFEYARGKKQKIDITNISLGYEFSYEKFDLLFYSSYNAGISKYELDISQDGYFISSKMGVKKNILGVSVGIFGYLSKDFIDDLELNIMSIGVSFGL